MQILEIRMHAGRMLMRVCGAALLGTTLVAQAPIGDMDAHINAAKAAAGLDYRATFVNLCFAGAGPPAGRGPGPGRGPAPATPARANWDATPYKDIDNFYQHGTRPHSCLAQ